MPLPRDWLEQFEAFIRRDPARRGLLSDDRFPPLLTGQLGAAAADLASTARGVAIVTGFYIPGGTPPAAETDGPPGALLLAQVLEQLGVRTWLLTDGACHPALVELAQVADFPESQVIRFPASPDGAPVAPDDEVHALWQRLVTDGLTHLISIERVGPCHTSESLERQSRPGHTPLKEFLTGVPEASRGRPHNMRGEDLSAHTAPIHLLFELAQASQPLIRTIGIGDGGNEIGMGAVPWEDLVRRLAGEQASRVPCRIATDATILAGVSNWGGYALAAATAVWSRRIAVLEPFTTARELHLLEQLVAKGPAVDGVTRRQEASVDGLPFLTYIQPWSGIRRLLGLAE